MDKKITLFFDKDIIEKAKEFAGKNNISFSRLTEYLYSRLTSKDYKSLEELPVSEWIDFVSEGEIQYQKAKSRKELNREFFSSKK